MRRLKAKRISSKAVRKLLAQTAHTLDRELSHAVIATVDVLADGRALVVHENGRGILYESIDELRAMIAETIKLAQQGPIHPLRNLLPQGQRFAESVAQLVAKLPAQLGIDAKDLDSTEASLASIDTAIRKIGNSRALTAELFPSLTAYVGEVIIQATSGRWEMRLGADGQTWEPWIIDSDGYSYPPFAIFKELYEREQSASLRAFVAGTIGGKKLLYLKR